MNTFLIYFNGQPMRGMYFMKSIVFSFKKRYLFRRSKGISPSDVRFFIRRYSVVLIFVSAFLTGLVDYGCNRSDCGYCGSGSVTVYYKS
jgi:hypothetical protein